MWIFYYLALLFLFSVMLVKATHLIVGSLRSLVAATGISAYGLASFVLAFSTSLPELSVAVSAAIHHQSGLVLGNVLGSNIANISLVLGLASVVAGAMSAYDSFLKREVFYAFIAGSLPLLMLLDGRLGWVEGLLLVSVYVLYNTTVLARNRKRLVRHEVSEMSLYRRLWVRMVDHRFQQSLWKLIFGVIGLLVAAELMVQVSMELAFYIDLPVLVVGLFVVAVGTSLPELAFELVAIREGDVQMGFGNILGSIVTNSTLIIGISALINPIVIHGNQHYFWYSMIAFVLFFFVFWFFVWTKHTLERIEGVVLVLLYGLFVWLQLM